MEGTTETLMHKPRRFDKSILSDLLENFKEVFMNPQAEYDRAMQSVVSVIPMLNADGLWRMRGMIDAMLSNPGFVKMEGKIIPFPAVATGRYT